MTVGDCFAGIGGMSLGLERAGMTIRWQVEVDPYARTVLERHWPAVVRRGDIRLIEPGDLEPVELVCGGFPCQPVSVAGKRRGDQDQRWLWPEMLRLVHGLRPQWVLAENVPGLRTRGADTVLSDLEAAGYTCWSLVVGAWAVGAPHRRDRVWIIARRVAHASSSELRDKSGRRGRSDGPSASLSRATMHDALAACPDAADLRQCWPARPGEAQKTWEQPRVVDTKSLRPRFRWWHQQPQAGQARGRVHRAEAESRVGLPVDGLSRRLALKALGNACVPQLVEAIGRAILAVA